MGSCGTRYFFSHMYTERRLKGPKRLGAFRLCRLLYMGRDRGAPRVSHAIEDRNSQDIISKMQDFQKDFHPVLGGS